MPEPTNTKLYEEVKKEIYAKYPKHSAYRSGILVQTYKQRFKDSGAKGSPYSGDKSKGSLGRWFKEDWKNQRGETGYKKKGDVYRPTKRVNSKTPTTFKELTKMEIESANKEKAKTGRVKEFKILVNKIGELKILLFFTISFFSFISSTNKFR